MAIEMTLDEAMEIINTTEGKIDIVAKVFERSIHEISKALEDDMYRLERIGSIIDIIQVAVSEGDSVIPDSTLSNSLYEISLLIDETLHSINSTLGLDGDSNE